MGIFDKNRFESVTQTWETPDEIFMPANNEFHFTRDVCASSENTKCKNFWSLEDSCLTKKWDGINWMNPPFVDMKIFIKKAFLERHNAINVCLLPARTNTNWWHEYCMYGEVYFIKGRPKFKGCKYGLPQPLSLIVFGREINIFGTFDLSKGIFIKRNQ